jgi:hypothetical protein
MYIAIERSTIFNGFLSTSAEPGSWDLPLRSDRNDACSTCAKRLAQRLQVQINIDINIHTYVYIYIYSFIHLFIYLVSYLFIYIYIYMDVDNQMDFNSASITHDSTPPPDPKFY